MASIIDDDGFQLERFEDSLEEYKQDYIDKFGDEIDLDDETIAYQLIAIDSKHEADINELVQSVYNSFDADGATGIQLDNLCKLTGIERLESLPTTVNVLCRGDENTQIPAGSTIAKNSGSYLFDLDSSVNLLSTACTEVFIQIDSVQNTTDYELTVTQGLTSEQYSYTSDASATESEIINGLVSDINGGSFDITAEPDGNYIHIYADNYIDVDFQYVLDTPSLISFYEIGVNGEFTAQEDGATIISAEEMTVISTPVSGWNSITNSLPGTTGRATETDDELRLRRSTAGASGAATDPKIAAALLQEVTGVTVAFIISNRTDSVVDSQPGNTFQPVIVGGDNNDIAEKIWETQPSGIQSYGTTTVSYTDEEGFTQDIKFTRPENVYVWIDIEYETDGTNPSNTDDLIKENIVELAGIEFEIRDDVLRQKLLEAIFDVDGITNVPTLELASKTVTSPPPNPGDYSANNITIGATQVSVFATSRIATAEV